MSEPFEEYVARRGTAMLRFAYLLTREHHLAEDLVQEVLARSHRRWSRIARLDHPDQYVRRAIVNEFLSWRRRRSSSEVAVTDFGDLPAGGRFGGDPAPRLAEQEQVRALLATLPRQQRAVLILRYYEDLSDAQIAEIIGCSAVTVRSHASKALGRLRTAQRDSDTLIGGGS